MVSNFNNFIKIYQIYKTGKYSFSEYSDLKNDMISFPLDFLDFKIEEFKTLKQNVDIYKTFLNFSKENLSEFSFNYLIIPIECNFDICLNSIICDDFNVPKLYAMKNEIKFLENSKLNNILLFNSIKISFIKTYIQEIDDYECCLVLSLANSETMNKVSNFNKVGD